MAIIYTLIRAIFKGLKDWFYIIAISIDQLGNVVGMHLFNDIMVKPNGHRFGNPDETISLVLAMNKKQGTLYPIGRALGWLLNKIDDGHLENTTQ